MMFAQRLSAMNGVGNLARLSGLARQSRIVTVPVCRSTRRHYIIGSWRPETKKVTYLPEKLEVMQQGKESTFYIDYLEDSQVAKAYEIVQKAAEKGKNVGLDEHPSLDHFNRLLCKSQAFKISSLDTSEDMQGCIVISPCRITRGFYPMIAEILIFLARDSSTQDDARLVSSIAPLCERITTNLGLGYTSCVWQVAHSCGEWMLQLRRLGYLITATIPKNVDMAGEGLLASWVLYRDVMPSSNKRPSHDVIKRLKDVAVNSVGEEEFQQANLLCPPHLPMTYQDDRGRYVVRIMKKEEDAMVFNCFQQAMKSGLGYMVDEFPTLEFFRGVILQCCPLVVEEENSGEFVGAFFLRPSIFTRNQKNLCCSGSWVMSRTRHATHITDWIYHFFTYTAFQLGYRYILSTTMPTNYKFYEMYVNYGDNMPVGTVPNTLFLADGAWYDFYITYSRLTGTDPVSAVAAFHRRLKKATDADVRATS